VWDLLEPKNISFPDPGFQHNIAGCKVYIQGIRQRYPNIEIYWLLPTAIHVHALEGNPKCLYDPICIERTYYASTSLNKELYSRQKLLMQELGVPVIDYFEESYLSARALMPGGDVRHYLPVFNVFASDWYFPGMEIMFAFG
jgi:hypothetical protein